MITRDSSALEGLLQVSEAAFTPVQRQSTRSWKERSEKTLTHTHKPARTCGAFSRIQLTQRPTTTEVVGHLIKVCTHNQYTTKYTGSGGTRTLQATLMSRCTYLRTYVNLSSHITSQTPRVDYWRPNSLLHSVADILLTFPSLLFFSIKMEHKLSGNACTQDCCQLSSRLKILVHKTVVNCHQE